MGLQLVNVKSQRKDDQSYKLTLRIEAREIKDAPRMWDRPGTGAFRVED